MTFAIDRWGSHRLAYSHRRVLLQPDISIRVDPALAGIVDETDEEQVVLLTVVNCEVSIRRAFRRIERYWWVQLSHRNQGELKK